MATISRTVPQRVDFFGNDCDFLCFAFASCGLSTRGIQKMLRHNGMHLSLSQINYRITLVERNRSEGQLTQRRSFREGDSYLAQVLRVQIVDAEGIGRTVKTEVKEKIKSRGIKSPTAPKRRRGR